MGGKGSGRKPIFHDKDHEKWRKYQLKYDREIAAIRKEYKCSFAEAQRIHRIQNLKAELKKLETKQEVK